MTATQPDRLAIVSRNLRKQFRRETGDIVVALDDVSIEVPHGRLAALVGPDGAGKTTLIRLIAGLMRPDAGTLIVDGIDVTREPQQVQDRIAYMPQRFGLYEDLSVQENLDLYADLHGVTAEERRQVYPQLMEMTALGPFAKRLSGRLSGGMKQKLGLACTLVRAPDLLLLDEPTVGVDPLSRRELWEITQTRALKEGEQYALLRRNFNRGLFEVQHSAQQAAKYVGGLTLHSDRAGTGRAPFGRGHRRTASNVVEGWHEGWAFVAFDYRYLTSDGEHDQEHQPDEVVEDELEGFASARGHGSGLADPSGDGLPLTLALSPAGRGDACVTLPGPSPSPHCIGERVGVRAVSWAAY